MNSSQIQNLIDKALLDGEPKQILVAEPKRYARGNDTPRIWLTLCCEKHGAYSAPKRLDVVTKPNGSRCKHCRKERNSLLRTKEAAAQNGSLQTLHPHIAAEWSWEKNNLSPDEIPAKSNRVMWWRCNRGHFFQQRVADRVVKRTSCTVCQKHLRVSKFELLLFSELRGIFGEEVFSQHQGPKHSQDIDLFIKPLNLAIEVDGYPWHLKTVKRDVAKQNQILSDGFLLLRFRDQRLPTVYHYEIRDNLSLQNTNAVTKLLRHIGQNFPLTSEQKHALQLHLNEGFQGQKLFNEMMASFPLPTSKSGSSVVDPISKTHPDLIEEWGDNGLLSPELVSKGQHIKVSWICKECGDTYVRSVHDRCQQKYGCRTCSVKQRTQARLQNKRKSGFTLAKKYPKLASEFDSVRNGCSPSQVTPGDGKKFWWNCPDCGMSYDASVHQRTKIGNGCPYCSGHRACHWNNLKTLFPDIDELWDYQKNADKKPEDYTSGSNELVIWTCKLCGKSKEGRISDRVNRENMTVRRFYHECTPPKKET